MQHIIQEDIRAIIASLKNEVKLFEGKTFLISGGYGFLGTYFVATLLALNKKVFKKPCKVIVLDNYITSSEHNPAIDERDPHFTLIQHDVRNSLPHNLKADYLIHAAGLASPFYYRKFPLETIEVAVHGTKNFLEFAKEKKVKSLLYFSSSEVYGDPNPNFIPTPEHYWGNVSAVGPRACYDESKRLGETLCMTYFQLYKVPVKIVRPFNVYGPGMKVHDYRVIPTFMVRALKGQPLPVHDKGNQTRTFCYITDAIQGFFKVLASEKNGEIYNVGRDDEEINMVGLATSVSDLLPSRPRVELISYPDSYPAGEPQRRCPDISKIKRELGYTPHIKLKTGLARTLAWYQKILSHDGEPGTGTLT